MNSETNGVDIINRGIKTLLVDCYRTKYTHEEDLITRRRIALPYEHVLFQTNYKPMISFFRFWIIYNLMNESSQIKVGCYLLISILMRTMFIHALFNKLRMYNGSWE